MHRDRAMTELEELRARVAHTLDYTDELLRLPMLNPQIAEVCRAVHNSLTTPIRGL